MNRQRWNTETILELLEDLDDVVIEIFDPEVFLSEEKAKMRERDLLKAHHNDREFYTYLTPATITK